MSNVFLGEPSEYIRNWFLTRFPVWPAYTTLKFVDGTTQTKEIQGAATWQNIGVKSSNWQSNNTLKYCQLGNKVTEISDYAFYWCSSLTSINIPSTVYLIGNYAFTHCDSLLSVNIPSSVTSIGGNAFQSCSSLTSINIPSSVSSIGNDAFSNCYSLTSVNIPSSVTSIGYAAFQYCSSLTSITVDLNNPSYDSRDNCNAIIETSSNTLIFGCGNSTIPNSVSSIGDLAFSWCYFLTSINIPNLVSSIGEGAFAACTSLSSITIPSSVTSIGSWAFAYNSKLISVTFEGKTTDQIKAMANYPWDIPNTNAIIAGIS